MNAHQSKWYVRAADRVLPRDNREPWPNDLRRAFKLFSIVFFLWGSGVIVTSTVYAKGTGLSLGSTLSQACACSAAAFGVGAAFGLLFGIPKSVPLESKIDGESSSYRANTALEQISDWFTKIVVGLGLTQFGPALRLGQELARYFGNGFGGNPARDVPFAASLLTLSSVIGFSCIICSIGPFYRIGTSRPISYGCKDSA